MNKQLTQDEISQCMSPVIIEPKVMTRHEKLMRLAKVVGNHSEGIYIFHRLEYYSQHELNHTVHLLSAFQLALGDQELREAGLKPDIEEAISVGAAQTFFELSKEDLHAFSCDCGGAITNATMAARIEKIAGVQPKSLLQKMSDSVFG